MSMSKPEIKDAVQGIIEDFPPSKIKTLRFTHLLEQVVKVIDGIDINDKPDPLIVNSVTSLLYSFYTRNGVKHKRWAEIEKIWTTQESNLIEISNGHYINTCKYINGNGIEIPTLSALELKFRFAVNLSDNLAVHMGNFTINGIPFPEKFFKRVMEYLENQDGDKPYLEFCESDLT